MAAGKWITDLHASTPLVDAARRVLSLRLDVVQECLPLAVHQWQNNVEHVHQLRVGTRRAGAALAIFAVCLSKKRTKKARNHLRWLRRAAGAARDWDVVSLDLADRGQKVTAGQRPGVDYLLGYAQAQRMEAQTGLQAAVEDAPFDFDNLATRVVAGVVKPNGRGRVYRLFGDLARPWLSECVGKFRAAATDNIEDNHQLHQVRIQGKRLRYGMEVFASCFNEEFRTRYYAMVEEMQEVLGLANDSRVFCQRLESLRSVLRGCQPAVWQRIRSGVDGHISFHQRRLTENRRRFKEWWERWLQSGCESALINMVHAVP